MDAHSRAFAFFGGVPARLIYDASKEVPSGDNLKAVVDTLNTGKERQFNRRFLTLAIITCLSRSPARQPPAWRKGKWRTKWAMCANGGSHHSR